MNKKIFLSYAHHDNLAAQYLITSLAQQGIQVLPFESVLTANDVALHSVIRSKIGESDAFVVLLSSDSQASGAVALEVGIAMGLGIHIVPVLLSGDFEDVPSYLRHLTVHKLGTQLYEALKEKI